MSNSDDKNRKLIDSINSGNGYFDKDEVENYSEEVLIAFTRNGKPVIPYLPKTKMTDSLLMAIAKSEKLYQLMRFITPEDTKLYREIAIMSVATFNYNAAYVDSSYIDEDFVTAALSMGNNKALGPFYVNHPSVMNELFSQDELEKLIESDNDLAKSFLQDIIWGRVSEAPITDDFIKKCLPSCPSLVAALQNRDKFHLVVDVVRNGDWPESLLKDKPSDLKDAVKRMMKPMNSTAQTWQKAYAMTFGIEQAVKAMKSPTRIELLQSIYTKEEILPHLTERKDLKAKGRWVEDELGL
ncbi:hypothetical protein [Pseudomonas putida]|uniref:Uncharacterized protein n=1 Tax=Pseudomonas putida TaxID=303 RepID=A0A8I1EBH4_PSEPU|nr:hypothetical protein [Pseudomonas putida]MBI6882601.1 hypothetical protein [Pseudomonas putida]